MHIPSRHIPKPEKAEEPKEVARIVEVKSDTTEIIAAIKKMLPSKPQAPSYAFSMIRDKDGLLEQVIARPLDTSTIM